MATRFEVAIPFGRPDAVAAAEDALDLIDDLETQLTVYNDQSEVARLNATAADGPVVVEDRLFDLLTTCSAWTRATEGAFDVSTGAIIRAWGFFRREGRIPTSRERVQAMAKTGTRHLILNPDARSVKYRVAGLEINLGAVGKGYALDRAAELLRDRWGIDSALLHGGGSSVIAIGHPPGEPRGWPIRLKHPWQDGESLGTVWLRDQGLGTSAATHQYFEYNGRKLGHLLDPRTARPAEGTASASATVPTAAEADAMSTALFVLGVKGAERLTQTRPQLGAVVLSDPPTPPKGLGKQHPRLTPSSGTAAGRSVASNSDTIANELSTFNLAPAMYSLPESALLD
jgi:thiamine biosynthesis lipoprotein